MMERILFFYLSVINEMLCDAPFRNPGNSLTFRFPPFANLQLYHFVSVNLPEQTEAAFQSLSLPHIPPCIYQVIAAFLVAEEHTCPPFLTYPFSTEKSLVLPLVLRRFPYGASKELVCFSIGRKPFYESKSHTHEPADNSGAVDVLLVSVCVAPSHLTALNKTLINTRSLNAPDGMVGVHARVRVCVRVCARALHRRHHSSQALL